MRLLRAMKPAAEFDNQGNIEKMRSNLESFFSKKSQTHKHSNPPSRHSKNITIFTLKKTRKKSISVRLIAKQSPQVMTMWQ